MGFFSQFFFSLVKFSNESVTQANWTTITVSHTWCFSKRCFVTIWTFHMRDFIYSMSFATPVLLILHVIHCVAHSLPCTFWWLCWNQLCVISVFNIHYMRQAMMKYQRFLHRWFDSMEYEYNDLLFHYWLWPKISGREK